MPRWSELYHGLGEKVRTLRTQLPGEPWAGTLADILKGLAGNTDDINRKIPLSKPTPRGGGGGGAVKGPPQTMGSALWTIEWYSGNLKPVMRDITYVKFEHSSNVRKLFGAAYPVTLLRMAGEIYIESMDDQSQARYYVDMRPMTAATQRLAANSLVGFSIGFERFGGTTHRGKLRMDSFEYAPSAAELTDFDSDKQSSCQWRSTNVLLSSDLLTDYENQGVKMFLTMTVYGK